MNSKIESLNCYNAFIIKPIDLKLHRMILDESLHKCILSDFSISVHVTQKCGQITFVHAKYQIYRYPVVWPRNRTENIDMIIFIMWTGWWRLIIWRRNYHELAPQRSWQRTGYRSWLAARIRWVSGFWHPFSCHLSEMILKNLIK